MGILSLLNDATISHFGQSYPIALNWIGQIIKCLIAGIGIVGVGIIVFSLILKLIVLPFDVMQRVSMRKQNQKMQENKEKLEKLQKQYANDKQKYNEKMMEFYKKNGISMMSSCLPMILSIVIFFVAIGAFNSYSQYAAVDNYNQMVTAYNQTIEEYTADFTTDNLYYSKKVEKKENPEKPDEITGYEWVFDCAYEEANHITIKDVNADNTKFVYVDVKFTPADFAEKTTQERVDYAKEVALGKKYENGNIVKDYYYRVNTEKTYDYLTTKASESEKASFQALYEEKENNKEKACESYVKNQARVAVEKKYASEISGDKKMSFLWIKNIWQTDAVYKHPVLAYGDFSSGMGNEKFDVSYVDYTVSIGDMGPYTTAYTSESYEEITANLGKQKSEPNGYFILIALSIGTILLQQIVTMKTQKAQNQFSTVDGQGGSQQKIMLIVMTVMFGIFSFMYSSAFSIYMITSNLVSLGSMLLINKIVDTVMNKKEEQKFKEKYSMKTHKKADGEKKK